MRHAWTATFLLVGSLGCMAQDSARKEPAPSKDPAPLEGEEVVKPEFPLSKRIVLVVDVSDSMDSYKGRACALVRAVAGRPIDEFELACIAFDDNWKRWPGLPEKDAARPVPKGWARFPSADALKSLDAFLDEAPRGGGTNPAPALASALREPRDDLSIIFVTDGVYQYAPVLQAVEKWQDAREKEGRGRAVIAAWGIFGEGRSAWRDGLEDLAKLGRGGLWRSARDLDSLWDGYPQAPWPSPLAPGPIPGVVAPVKS